MINKGLMTSKESCWLTPKDFFEMYREHYNIVVDTCATPGQQLCKHYFAPEKCGWDRLETAPSRINGLTADWHKYVGTGESVWMNPPYGRDIKYWVNKAKREWVANKVVSVCLLPARTDTQWFHNDVYPVLRGQIPGTVKFIKGRLKFTDANTGKTGPAPFPSVVVVYGDSRPQPKASDFKPRGSLVVTNPRERALLGMDLIR